MRIAVINDPHIDIKGGNANMLKYQRLFWDDLAVDAEAGEFDSIVFNGDFFHNRHAVTGKAFCEASWMVRKVLKPLIHDRGGWAFAVTGNHDLFYKNSYEYSVAREHFSLMGIHYAKQDVGWQFFPLGNDQYAIAFDFRNTPDEYEVMLKQIKKDLNINKNVKYVFGHFEMVGFMMTTVMQNTFTEAMAQDFVSSRFPNLKRIYSGHYHIPQERGITRYGGVPYELTWDESGMTLGYWILDTETGEEEFKQNKRPLHVHLRPEAFEGFNPPSPGYDMQFKVHYSNKDEREKASEIAAMIREAGHGAVLVNDDAWVAPDSAAEEEISSYTLEGFFESYLDTHVPADAFGGEKEKASVKIRLLNRLKELTEASNNSEF